MSEKTNLSKNITIIDVAAEANVSKSTVSLVLKGSHLIKGDTAERVKEAAIKLGYIYNRRAGELRGNSSNAIGVVINDLMNPFFAEVLVGIERKLVEAGFVVLIAHTNENLELQNKLLMSMREQNAAGIMLCPAINTPRSIVKTIQSWGIPLTVFVRNLGPGSYDFAGTNSEEGTYLATCHLLNSGHTRIGFLGGQEGVVYTERLAGYKRALNEKGITFSEDIVVKANPNRQGGHEAMFAILKITPKVNVAVCYNDIVAYGALSALGEKGLRAGTDFYLMGFDNLLASAHSNPPLSTVDIQPSDLGEHAAAILLKRIQNPNAKKIVFNTKPFLQLRQTA